MKRRTKTAPAKSKENPVDAYARQVVAGEILAGKYHRLACERHLKDRARENTPGFPFRFIWEARNEKGQLQQCALRFLDFSRKTKHYKGRQFAGKPFDPTPCQVFRLGSIFGWRHVDTGYRRFTTAYNELPRKNGKTFEEALVAIYVTFFEGESGAEGYNVATKEKQARIAFDNAKKLVQTSGLASRIKVNASNLHRLATSQKLEPIGSDSDTTDGLNPHFIGIDEFHAFKHRDLIDVLESATGARVNPLNFQITTAGNDPVSPCGDQHDYACKILDNVLPDDASTLSFFAFIAHADVDDDPFSEETWRKANPHYGISVEPEDLRKLAAKARNMPSAANEFKQKRLNIWVNADAPWLSLEGWRAGQSVDRWDPLEMKGEDCWIGVDLASKADLAALSVVFPPTQTRFKWRVLLWAWTPKDTLSERAHRDRAPYEVWAEQGHLLAIDGKSLNHNALVRGVLKELRPLYRIRQLGFDPWHAEQTMKQLIEDDGFDREQVIEVPQTYQGMSRPCLDFEAAVLGGEIDANGSPLMAYCVSNAVVQRDGKDNIYPVKKRSRGRIDPVMATITGFKLADLGRQKPAPRKRRGARVWTPDGFKDISGDAA